MYVVGNDLRHGMENEKLTSEAELCGREADDDPRLSNRRGEYQMQMEVITEEPTSGKEHDERRSRLRSSCARCTRHTRRRTMSTTCGTCGLDDQNDRVGTRTRDGARTRTTGQQWHCRGMWSHQQSSQDRWGMCGIVIRREEGWSLKAAPFRRIWSEGRDRQGSSAVVYIYPSSHD